ncbi:MAG: NAD+ synthase [Actinomycetota bacterium]|nr:NAD+ synthase [Actinomycetota bacterium]
MTRPLLRLAIAQINPTVGAVSENAELVRSGIERAKAEGADLVVFGELCLSGYPAEDLYLKRHFLARCADELSALAEDVEGIAALVGFPEPRLASADPHDGDAPRPRHAHNSLAFLRDGEIEAVYRKQRLPNYGVFDERRYFEPGTEPVVVDIARVKVGLTICEDAWEPGPPLTSEAELGAQLIVNASGSPYLRGKRGAREAMFARRAQECGTPIAFVNLVGGQDELVFDGSSFVLDAGGEVLARAKQFSEDFVVVDFEGEPARVEEPLPDPDEVYSALVTGLRDYVEKNGFRHVVVAVSGGIDSALVALVAADALGGDRLTGVVMPSPHSSSETQGDARAIVRNLGADLVEIPIEGAMDIYADALEGSLDGAGGLGGITAENLQARIRGNLLMALSNAHGWLVLTTGNKSEMSVGYATLYGDMAGGFAVIKDVPKTLVYDLVRHRNARSPKPLVPRAVIERPPSAELRPDQRDDDSLPPYEVLDRILDAYIADDRSRDEIVAAGDDAAVVDEVIRMVDLAEYKRRQAPPGIRITAKAFGRDRRLPITNRFGG